MYASPRLLARKLTRQRTRRTVLDRKHDFHKYIVGVREGFALHDDEEGKESVVLDLLRLLTLSARDSVNRNILLGFKKLQHAKSTTQLTRCLLICFLHETKTSARTHIGERFVGKRTPGGMSDTPLTH